MNNTVTRLQAVGIFACHWYCSCLFCCCYCFLCCRRFHCHCNYYCFEVWFSVALKSWKKTCPLFCCQFLRIAGGFKILLGFSLERGMGGADLNGNNGNTKNIFNNLLLSKTSDKHQMTIGWHDKVKFVFFSLHWKEIWQLLQNLAAGERRETSAQKSIRILLTHLLLCFKYCMNTIVFGRKLSFALMSWLGLFRPCTCSSGCFDLCL